MKNNLFILFALFLSSLFSEQREFVFKEFKESGRIDGLVDDVSSQMYLVELDIKNDSLLNHISTLLPNLELYAGPSTYHRIMNENYYLRIAQNLDQDFFQILDENYNYPQSREYWTLTLQGNQNSESSGEVNNSCMCLDNSSNCLVVGYNDSWYNPFDYYGEASWNFSPPPNDQIVEARVYVSGSQCDNLPLYSETNLSVKNNSCNWSDFQVTLSADNTINGPYIISDDILDQILEEIPHARLLFFEGLKKHNLNTLLSRWKEKSKYILSRLIICPRVNFDDYLTISKRFDIVLDTFYFGMGNTFFQAMALGIPVVTLLADQPRGATVSAGYKQMGILNPPIANSPKEYISIAKQLAFDTSYRENISNQILLKSKDHLFNDNDIYKQYIDFFQKSLEAAYKKELLPKNWEPSMDNQY